MRRILPTSVSSRCGLPRVSGRDDSPEPPSPLPMYMTRQSPSPRRAVGIEDDVAERVNARVQLQAQQLARGAFERACSSRFVSVHSISTPSRVIGPGRRDRRRHRVAGRR